MRLNASQILAGSAGIAGGVAGVAAGIAGLAGGFARGVAELAGGVDGRVTGSVFLANMPAILVSKFSETMLMEMCDHLAEGHGVMALGGTASPQGGHVVIDVIDFVDELAVIAHWCKP